MARKTATRTKADSGDGRRATDVASSDAGRNRPRSRRRGDDHPRTDPRGRSRPVHPQGVRRDLDARDRGAPGHLQGGAVLPLPEQGAHHAGAPSADAQGDWRTFTTSRSRAPTTRRGCGSWISSSVWRCATGGSSSSTSGTGTCSRSCTTRGAVDGGTRPGARRSAARGRDDGALPGPIRASPRAGSGAWPAWAWSRASCSGRRPSATSRTPSWSRPSGPSRTRRSGGGDQAG